MRDVPDAPGPRGCHRHGMAVFILAHRHTPDECPVVFAAWTGFTSPLRGQSAWASCLTGGHCLWWTVEAAGEAGALALLPDYVARRTDAILVRSVTIP